MGDSIFTFIAFILFIAVIILLIAQSHNPNSGNPFINAIQAIVRPLLNFIKGIIRINSTYSETYYLLILIPIIVIAGIAGHMLLIYLYDTVISMSSKKNIQKIIFRF